jgi:hypothetical protein
MEKKKKRKWRRAGASERKSERLKAPLLSSFRFSGEKSLQVEG